MDTVPSEPADANVLYCGWKANCWTIHGRYRWSFDGMCISFLAPRGLDWNIQVLSFLQSKLLRNLAQLRRGSIRKIVEHFPLTLSESVHHTRQTACYELQATVALLRRCVHLSSVIYMKHTGDHDGHHWLNELSSRSHDLICLLSCPPTIPDRSQ